MEKKSVMAFPTFSTPASAHGSTPGGSSGLRRPAITPCVPPAPGCSSVRSSENDHQLEKLEFALAVAITRGDGHRIQTLRDQIAALGGNCEEPGT
jgi:uncharacterized protein (DUF1499 family)